MRLIDLRCNWLRQYFAEMTAFEGSADAGVAGRLGQLDGYLSDTAVAGLICSRTPADWESTADPWAMLAEMIARYQAEFSGRILMGPDDARRWIAEPADGLCWGLIGADGLDYLVRTPGDLDRLPMLFDRGIRLFRPIATGNTQLGGCSDPGDDRGLTELGRLLLEQLLDLSPAGSPALPRPILDLARMNPATMRGILGWYEADPARLDRVPLMMSHGSIAQSGPDADPSRVIPLDDLKRFRSVGGMMGLSVGPPYIASAGDLADQIGVLETIPFGGRKSSAAGIAIGTDFLGATDTLSELKNVESILNWLSRTFDRATVEALAFGNARELFLRAVGWVEPSPVKVAAGP